MKPGKIAQDIDDELKRERRRKARALRLKKLIDEYKNRREGGINDGKTKNIHYQAVSMQRTHYYKVKLCDIAYPNST